MNLKDPSGRLARWALRLQEHDFDVKYKTGKKHSDADALSRNPVEEETETSDKFLAVTTRKNFDPDGKLWLPVIPKHLRADILRHFHDAPTAGHLGFAKTYDRIRKRFYWPGMYRNVVRYVMHCRECQRRKSVPQRPPGRLVPIPPAIAPFHRIELISLGDFQTEVDKIAKFLLEEIVLRHGAPRVIITDRGAVFRSRLVSSLVDLCNIDHRFTTAYHPQTNGLTERFNKTLADMLSISQSEESRQLARVHTLRAQDKDRRRYDSKHQMVSYAPGDLVWVYTPYKILILLHEKEKLREVVHVLRMKPYHDPAEQIETEDIPPKESYKGPITRSRIKTLEQNDSGALSSFRGEQCRTHKSRYQVPIAELAERWTELPQVSDESRSFFRVHTGYFSNIPKCIKAEFIASWACSQSSVVSSSKR
ncbi:transposon Tf2-11 polyprotein [Trichonephila clavipes]|nr:transposon Tf2-11 polyprotein [Trichonephila clavipes]